jgi:hypothetical protein
MNFLLQTRWILEVLVQEKYLALIAVVGVQVSLMHLI